MVAPLFTIMGTAARASRFLGAAPVTCSIWQRCSGACVKRRQIRKAGARRLRQRNALERTDDIVGAFFSKEAFVKAGAKVPVRTLVVIVAIKTQDATYDDETTDPIVPIIADVMEVQVRTRERAAKASVILKDQIRKTYNPTHDRYQ